MLQSWYTMQQLIVCTHIVMGTNTFEKGICQMEFPDLIQESTNTCKTQQNAARAPDRTSVDLHNSQQNFYSSIKDILLRPEFITPQNAKNPTLIYGTIRKLGYSWRQCSRTESPLCAVYNSNKYILFITLKDSVASTPLSSHQHISSIF